MPEWQTAASGVLVAMGMKYCNEVMEQMLANFKPGVLPHFFVVQTIANLSTANGKYIFHSSKQDFFFQSISIEYKFCYS